MARLTRNIYYTGIGGYLHDHLYSAQEFIQLMNDHQHEFNLDDVWELVPVVNPNLFSQEDLQRLVDWAGAEIRE